MLFAFVKSVFERTVKSVFNSIFILANEIFCVETVSMVADYTHNYHSLFLPSNVKGTYGLQFLP